MQKNKKYHYGFISSQNGMGQAENDTKKKMLSFQSIQTQHGKGNCRKIAKKFKKLKKKNHYGLFSSQNVTRQAKNERKKKLSFRSIPTKPGIGNSKKRAKNFKKFQTGMRQAD